MINFEVIIMQLLLSCWLVFLGTVLIVHSLDLVCITARLRRFAEGHFMFGFGLMSLFIGIISALALVYPLPLVSL